MDKPIQRITSFTVDHDVLQPGFYISRIDGDVTTFDLRTRRPNCGNYANLSLEAAKTELRAYLQVLEGLEGSDFVY